MRIFQRWTRHRHRPRIVYFLLSSTLLLLLIVWMIPSAFATSQDDPNRREVISGHMVPGLKTAHMLRTSDSKQRLDLVVALQLRNQGQLQHLLWEQHTLGSAHYHRYLTVQEFIARFSPDPSSVQRVVSYLTTQGIQVTRITPNRQLIDISGSVESIERAFDLQIGVYKYQGREVYAPTREPSVPLALRKLIVGIIGLDNATQPRRHSSTNATPTDGGPQRPPVPGAGPAGGYTPDQLRNAYTIKPLLDQGYDGSGQTIAIFELAGYKPEDVNAYLSYYHLGSPKYSNILVDGASNIPSDASIEVELDMEVISAIAPNARQLVYIAPGSNRNVVDEYNQIVTDDLARVTSISWGSCEAQTNPTQIYVLHNIFSEGATQGQAFFDASGDDGAYDCGDTRLSVDSPAGDPLVIGVGGTQLHLDTQDRYKFEQVWSCRSCATPDAVEGSGGGGGVSVYFPRPWYQYGHGLTSKMRMVPDVSADADPRTGYSVYSCITQDCSVSGWKSVGGTSAAAPLWAAIATNLNQYLSSYDLPGLGNGHEALYKLYQESARLPFAPYHDITVGNNLYYPAHPGYDLASGLGTPNVWNIARDLRLLTQKQSKRHW